MDKYYLIELDYLAEIHYVLDRLNRVVLLWLVKGLSQEAGSRFPGAVLEVVEVKSHGQEQGYSTIGVRGSSETGGWSYEELERWATMRSRVLLDSTSVGAFLAEVGCDANVSWRSS